MAEVVYMSKITEALKMTEEKLRKAAEIIGLSMETHAKEYITKGVYEIEIPDSWYKRTGRLRNNITHDIKEDEEATQIIVGSNVEYAPYVELGTGKYVSGGRPTPWSYTDDEGNEHWTAGMPPRPFLRPAVENHLKEYENILVAVSKS